ncbi:MAG: hypothetical protein FWG31_10280 [Oscillospiraceae bacterium]|nr:hypothetical protein [Oscillospiraceae bacterium]
MSNAHQYLYDEISKLPLEKVGKAISFIRYLEQEPELELVLDPDEEEEMQKLLHSGDFVNGSDMLASIKALPDDTIS